ncbi:eCIS core domain-containing protein [Acaryochloris marina NIES-2412]|uniref:eCIS core domain-containing protein n=1 Tax=Acaryochloris marina TaxID=155978 RepID=UPI0040581979
MGVQQTMGQAMGADFSGVRVHTDAQSNQLNQSLQAKAFTTGQDVFFQQGAYAPEKQSGQELIAHELTHVVQQNGPCIQQSKKQVTSPALTDSSLSEINLNESNHVLQRGSLEKHLGNANPRKHIPEAIGGYTPQQNQRNTTRAALRVIGLQDNVVETLVGIHLTRNPPLGYNHADMLTLGLGINNLGGTNVLAQRVVNIINTLGAPVLPVADLVNLMGLHAVRNDLEIANLATASLTNPAWGAVRLRDLAQLPQNLTVPDIVTLGPLNLTPADIGNLLAGPQNLTVPDIVTLAPLTRTLANIRNLLVGNILGVPAPIVAEIVQLEGTSNADIGRLAGLGQVNTVAHIIQLKGALARGGARPLADLVTLGTNLPNLTVNELDALAVDPAVNNLGEYLVQDGIQQNRTADNVINESHTNANTGQRQAVANHDALRSVIRERWVAGGDATAIMATFLEGSLYWPAGSGPEPSENYQIRLGSTFASWIRGGNENENKPTANAVSTMNCWEGVLFAAYLAGKLTYLQLTNIHIQVATAANLIDPGGAGFAAFQAWDAGGRVGPIPLAAYNAANNAQNAYYDGLAQFLNAHNSNPWDPTAMPLTGVPRGHIMFFTDQAPPTNKDKLEHVAISLGRGVGGNAEIMSHWNQPGNSFQYLTINQLFTGTYNPDVYTAPCPW